MAYAAQIREINSSGMVGLLSFALSSIFGSQVGSGKSSLLEALLGEILPIQSNARSVTSPSNSPILRGRVAYCSQVPWIVSGTLRVRRQMDPLLPYHFQCCMLSVLLKPPL